jgi:2-polyprenyl-3-methyl-5-hydroxy-6-metoxy-1,4-benzoquinol methylase
VRARRIGILVVAHNASGTLADVLSRIPPELRGEARVLVCDDHSDDATYLVGLGYQQVATDLPLTVIRQSHELGYGGNQKAGYRWAIEHGLDIVVLLHADGQYAPESLPAMVGPLLRDEADVVLGSRMLEPGEARRGGMPRYKYVANRALTRIENSLVGTTLSEWHSGYRAYSVPALRDIAFDSNSDGYEFDNELLIQLHEAGKRIVEVPVPTYYGEEIRHFKGMQYSARVLTDAGRYRLHRMGFGSGELAFAHTSYEMKDDPQSSHGRIISWLRDRPPGRILDLGCDHGALGERLREAGHHVTGVDAREHEGTRERLDEFVVADLERGVPNDVGDGYDAVILADVLEHVRNPDRILDDARNRLRPGGSIIVSIPNFGHWYPRLRTAIGAFDYDRRGILDRGHLRFFTRRSFERLVHDTDLAVTRREAVGIPLEVTERGQRGEHESARSAKDVWRRVEGVGLALRPTLLAYQFLYELRPETHNAPRAAVDAARAQDSALHGTDTRR